MLHVLTHSFPTRRSSELTAHEVGGRGFHEALADRGIDALAAAVGLNENNLGHGSERPYQSGGHIVKRQSTRRPYFRTGGVIADIEGLAMDWRLVRYGPQPSPCTRCQRPHAAVCRL